MNTKIEPVTADDVVAAVNALPNGLLGVLEQDRRRVAERQAARPLEKIDRDESYGRSYIPVAPGWEVQTKGKGSTFRLCEPSGDRLAVPDSPYLHATIERMALAIHAHRVAMEEEIERLRAEVRALKAKPDEVLVLSKDGVPAEMTRLLAEVALRKSEVELFRDELKARCDEVASLKADLEFHVGEVKRLHAACAAKDEALRQASTDLRTVGNDYPGSSCYEWCWKRADAADLALSTDAGKGWIDASGAVEATVQRWEVRGAFGYFIELSVPGDWAGSRVLIVRKP